VTGGWRYPALRKARYLLYYYQRASDDRRYRRLRRLSTGKFPYDREGSDFLRLRPPDQARRIKALARQGESAQALRFLRRLKQQSALTPSQWERLREWTRRTQPFFFRRVDQEFPGASLPGMETMSAPVVHYADAAAAGFRSALFQDFLRPPEIDREENTGKDRFHYYAVRHWLRRDGSFYRLIMYDAELQSDQARQTFGELNIPQPDRSVILRARLRRGASSRSIPFRRGGKGWRAIVSDVRPGDRLIMSYITLRRNPPPLFLSGYSHLPLELLAAKLASRHTSYMAVVPAAAGLSFRYGQGEGRQKRVGGRLVFRLQPGAVPALRPLSYAAGLYTRYPWVLAANRQVNEVKPQLRRYWRFYAGRFDGVKSNHTEISNIISECYYNGLPQRELEKDVWVRPKTTPLRFDRTVLSHRAVQLYAALRQNGVEAYPAYVAGPAKEGLAGDLFHPERYSNTLIHVPKQPGLSRARWLQCSEPNRALYTLPPYLIDRAGLSLAGTASPDIRTADNGEVRVEYRLDLRRRRFWAKRTYSGIYVGARKALEKGLRGQGFLAKYYRQIHDGLRVTYHDVDLPKRRYRPFSVTVKGTMKTPVLLPERLGVADILSSDVLKRQQKRWYFPRSQNTVISIRVETGPKLRPLEKTLTWKKCRFRIKVTARSLETRFRALPFYLTREEVAGFRSFRRAVTRWEARYRRPRDWPEPTPAP